MLFLYFHDYEIYKAYARGTRASQYLTDSRYFSLNQTQSGGQVVKIKTKNYLALWSAYQSIRWGRILTSPKVPLNHLLLSQVHFGALLWAAWVSQNPHPSNNRAGTLVAYLRKYVLACCSSSIIIINLCLDADNSPWSIWNFSFDTHRFSFFNYLFSTFVGLTMYSKADKDSKA